MDFNLNTGIGQVADFAKSIINRVLPDSAQKAAALLELQKMEQQGELTRMTAVFDDLKSARLRESDIAVAEHAPLINKIVTPLLALGIIGLTFTLFGYLLWSNVPIPAERKDIIIYILGVLSAICTQIVGYYFGSTDSSKKRSDSLVKLLEGDK